MARVLLLENDPELQEILTACLEFDHHEVTVAKDLSGGRRLLAEDVFDLVLTELFASPFAPDAVASLAELYQLAPDTPIVLTSSWPQAEGLNPATCGLSAIVPQPFELEDFLTCVHDVLAQSRQAAKELHARATEARAQLEATRGRMEASWELLRRVQEGADGPPAP